MIIPSHGSTATPRAAQAGASRSRALVLFVVAFVAGAAGRGLAQTFVRGDANRDGRVDWGDAAAFVAGFRDSGGGAPVLPCLDAADLNDDGLVLLDDIVLPGGVPIPRPSDLDHLIEFLFSLGPGSAPVDTRPAAPFPLPGPDATRDVLTCARGVEPPARPSESYRMRWIGPERVNSGDTAIFTLRVSAPQAMHGASFAYVVDSRVFDVTAIAMDPATMDAVTRRTFERSRLFRWKLEIFPEIADSGRRLLRFAVVLADAAGRPIDSAATRGATVDFPLVRVFGRVPETAPSGPRVVMTPFTGTYAQDMSKLIGGLRTQIIGDDGFAPFDLSSPSSATFPVINVGEIQFLRADANDDGLVDLSDASRTLSYLFLESNGFIFAPDAADANDNGVIDLADPVYTLNWLFLGGPSPPFPFPSCGEDLTDDLLIGYQIGCAFQ